MRWALVLSGDSTGGMRCQLVVKNGSHSLQQQNLSWGEDEMLALIHNRVREGQGKRPTAGEERDHGDETIKRQFRPCAVALAFLLL